MPSPAAAGSGEPNLAAGGDGALYLSWLEPFPEGGTALRFARWTGEGWSKPRTVAHGGDWFVNWADVPAMNALADGTLAASWLEKVPGDLYAYGIRIALSHDGGDTWSAPVIPHRDTTLTEHGFVSMAPVGPDRFGVAWLDGRETGGGEEDSTLGPMTLRYATVDRDGRLGDETLLDARVCDCCGTDLVLLAGGSPAVFYRDRSEDETRDIAVVRRAGEAWTEPAPVHADGWKIAGCPVNGPAAASADDRLAVAWYTAPGGERGRVRCAFSSDRGRTFGAPVELSDGDPLGRMGVVLDPDGAARVSWLESGGEGVAAIHLRRVAANGVPEPVRVGPAMSAERGSGFPRLARWKDQVVLAWTELGDSSRVRTARLR